MKFQTHSPEATESLGERLGKLLRPGDVVALIGDLGSGKTCLTRGIARGVGLRPGQVVNSPSYVLINEYQATCPVYHIDLYRIADATALLDLGLEEYLFGEGICIIEWADRAQEWLPASHLRIHLTWIDETSRELTLIPVGRDWEARLEREGWKRLYEDPGC